MSRFFAIYDGEDELRYQMTDLPLLIGTGKSCHIRLAEGHDIEARIDVQDGKYLYLKPTAADGAIFHNDQLITDSTWIKSGDQTRIGDWVILYRISGDRVEIIKKRYTIPEPANDLPRQKQNTGIPEASSLPPIAAHPPAHGGRLKRNIFAGIFFILLLLAALFVLTAHTLDIQIQPQPDSLTVQGKLPLLHIGKRFLGAAGTYSLHAEKAAFEDLQTEVVISADTPSHYSFTLKKLPGQLTVNSTPPGVEVVLDKKNIGKTPIRELQVTGGTHTLTCRAERYSDFQKTIEIVSGTSQSVHCLMKSSLGRVFIVSDPAGAVVMQGDSSLGKTPLTLELAAGERTLTLQKKGFAPITLPLKVKAGETLTPPVVTLQRQALQLTIRSVPDGAVVTSEGKQLGTTPLTTAWQPGSSHKLNFSLRGYETVSKKITVKNRAGQEIKITMQPVLASVKIAVSPVSARLYIDGKKQKKNSGIFKLTTTSHRIEAKAPGYNTELQRVIPTSKRTKNIFFDLDKTTPKPGAATVAASVQPASSTPSFQKIEAPSMVSLGPGVFTMGASRREPGRRANEGRHQVEITRPFLLCTHEVTNGEFHRFQPGHKAGNIGGQSLDTDNLPVVKVSWQDAARYCNWLSRQEGLAPFYREQGATLVPVKPASSGYRLPFEAEWEFAARKVARTRPGSYPWDGKFPPPAHHGNYADESARTLLPVVIRGYYDGFPVLAPVRNFPRNMAGLFDMGGNVSEWCHDFYSPVTAPMSGRAVDPAGPASGKYHVYRGSSWRDGAITELRISYRGYANTAKDSLGFRVARYK